MFLRFDAGMEFIQGKCIADSEDLGLLAELLEDLNACSRGL